MNINFNIQTTIQDFLGEKINATKSVSGGCIADSRIIETENGKKYFLKTFSGNQTMFLNEANGLKELAKANALRIPSVILASKEFLLLENISNGIKKTDFFVDFGTSFAKMHRTTAANFGFFEDNFIGATPQLNISQGKENTNWTEFYFNKRIMAQYRFAEANGYATTELAKNIYQLENKIEVIIGNSTEAPTLLHGDLWSGNYMCDENGKAVLIDPAVYYGHREADLAMTKMFGGFTPQFYQAYQNEYPLKEGWQYRQGLYLLYHYMNHLNLFGTSYYRQCIELIKAYI